MSNRAAYMAATAVGSGAAAYALYSWRSSSASPPFPASAEPAAAGDAPPYTIGTSGWAAPGAPAGHRLASAWCLMPHPDKVYKGGEDAAFGSPHAIGVADGVGGWAERGVDPGLYSKGLMEAARQMAEGAPPPGTPTPTALLRGAYDVIEGRRVLGSTTAIVATLQSVGPAAATVHFANLGDSGIMIVRPAEGGAQKVYRSVEQQHAFNFPFQLGGGSSDKPECATPAAAVQAGAGRLPPDRVGFVGRHAVTESVAVEVGDLLMLGTDGLFDNLFDEELLAIVEQHLQGKHGLG